MGSRGEIGRKVQKPRYYTPDEEARIARLINGELAVYK
ncbi:MAG: hypothetical protein JWQ24_4157 [Tardiphaga sp.]|nr:hypothetical protein [Tardiphaga sp.]